MSNIDGDTEKKLRDLANLAVLIAGMSTLISLLAMCVSLMALFRDEIVTQQANPTITVLSPKSADELQDERMRLREGLPLQE